MTVPSADFATLSPDSVIDVVEEVLHERGNNICRPLNSYINRVYEVGLASGEFVIAKFYRPGRWSLQALQDEVDFLLELTEAEVPVVPPVASAEGSALHQLGDIPFSVFPKKGGRPLEEPARDVWPQMGRLIGRMHQVGAHRMPQDRIHLHPAESTEEHLDYILDCERMVPEHADEFEDVCGSIIDLISPLFDDVEAIRIHADLHGGNILHRPGDGYHILDFDDLSVGPAVQDLWLILPDRLPNARYELDALLSGYELFHEFSNETLRLIEPLRAMRYIHYTAWCARQIADGGFSRLAPDWGTATFWRREIADLLKQKNEIKRAI